MREISTSRRAAAPLVAGLLWAGCGGPGESCGEPLYAGSASDEAWRTMVDAEDDVLAGDPNAAVLSVPAEEQSFRASDPPPLFFWTSPLAATTRPTSPARAARPIPITSAWQLASRWLVATAQAHLPPVTGDIHALEILVPGRGCPIEVLTTDLSWQVDEASWAIMRDAEGVMSIDVTSAYLTENRVTEGPYRSATPRYFSIIP